MQHLTTQKQTGLDPNQAAAATAAAAAAAPDSPALLPIQSAGMDTSTHVKRPSQKEAIDQTKYAWEKKQQKKKMKKKLNLEDKVMEKLEVLEILSTWRYTTKGSKIRAQTSSSAWKSRGTVWQELCELNLKFVDLDAGTNATLVKKRDTSMRELFTKWQSFEEKFSRMQEVVQVGNARPLRQVHVNVESKHKAWSTK